MSTHVDEWLDSPELDPNDPINYAKFVIEYFRLPAYKQTAYKKWMSQFKLFCTFEGKRYRCTGASRMGDVWLNSNFDQDYGYTERVDINQCSNWSSTPVEE